MIKANNQEETDDKQIRSEFEPPVEVIDTMHHGDRALIAGFKLNDLGRCMEFFDFLAVAFKYIQIYVVFFFFSFEHFEFIF